MQKELNYTQLAFYGSFIEEQYITCHQMSKTCKWRIEDDHVLYKHLYNACYLSGSFNLQCPVKKIVSK